MSIRSFFRKKNIFPYFDFYIVKLPILLSCQMICGPICMFFITFHIVAHDIYGIAFKYKTEKRVIVCVIAVRRALCMSGSNKGEQYRKC